MTLVDAGPLVALFDRNDRHHARCWEAMEGLPAGGMVSTWPCLAEAMYLLGRAGGHSLQARLWELRRRRKFRIHLGSDAEADRMDALMVQYQDQPMDLADASLVAAAETLRVSTVFTLDRHFYAYRTAEGGAFTVVP